MTHGPWQPKTASPPLKQSETAQIIWLSIISTIMGETIIKITIGEEEEAVIIWDREEEMDKEGVVEEMIQTNRF